MILEGVSSSKAHVTTADVRQDKTRERYIARYLYRCCAYTKVGVNVE